MSSQIPGSDPVTGTGTSKGLDPGEPSNGELDVLSDGEVVEETGLEEATVTDDEDETPTEPDEEDESTEENDDDSEESDEVLEDEEEEELEEELEDEEIESSSSWQTIKTKYPELAKDRNFKQIFFGYKAYGDIFPGGVNQARESVTKSEVLDNLDRELASGDPTIAFKSMNEETMNRMAGKLLPALYKFNPKYFAQATRPLVIDVLNNIHDYSVKIKDDNLRKSVRNISNYLFQSPDIPKREGSSTQEESDEVKAERERLQNQQRQIFERDRRKFLIDADSRVGNRLTKLIESSLDPKNEFNLTGFAKEAITERVLRDIKTRLNEHENLSNRLQGLHAQAIKENFSSDISSRITSAYLTAAKRLIPMLVSKHRNAALGRTVTRGKTETRKTVVKTGTKNSTGSPGKVTTKRSIDMKRTSPEDFLNDKVIYK